MSRPFKCRRIYFNPKVLYFKPRAIPLSVLKEVTLTFDEIESIRLADLNGMYQEEAAKMMRVSRQTFGNIIKSAHKKIADAIITGKAMKIEGGIYELDGQKRLKFNRSLYIWKKRSEYKGSYECISCIDKGIAKNKTKKVIYKKKIFKKRLAGRKNI